MKTSTLPDDPEFAVTALAYGGAGGYAQAQAAGRTHLDYRQWVQVRTPAFKTWFGDWEGGNAHIRPVTLDLAGWSGSASELSALAREVYTKELQGSTIDNASLGAPVAFSAEGKGEAFGARGKLRNPARAELVRMLREVVGGAVAVAQEAPKKGREVDTRAFHTLVAPLSVNGQTHAVKVTVREALKVPPGDAAHKFYDVTSIQINRSPDVHGLDGTEAPAHPAPVEASVVMVADLARAFNLNVHVDPASVSKVTDPATGEPLVLYRGTEATFAAFSREHLQDGLPTQPGLFFTRTPPSSDAAPPVFLKAKTPDGAIDHIHDGDAWLVFDPAQVQNTVGNPLSLDQEDPTIVHTHSSAEDQPITNLIQNESTIYGIPRRRRTDGPRIEGENRGAAPARQTGPQTQTVTLSHAAPAVRKTVGATARRRHALINTSNLPNDPEFTATARAYGGTKGYAQARAAGRTNLNYPQWVQVRTPTFKERFGDWEALRAQERLDAMSPIQVRVPEEWRGLEKNELRKKAVQALREIVESGAPLTNNDIGEVSVSNSTGVGKFKSTSADPAKLCLAADLRSAFQAAVFASSQAPADTKREPNVAAYEKLLATVEIDGSDLVAVFTVQRHTDGRQFYNAVTLENGQKKTPVVSPRDTPEQVGERAASANTEVDSFIRPPLHRVNLGTGSDQNAVTPHDDLERNLEKGKAQDSYGRPDRPENGSSIAPITGLAEFIRRPLRRVNPYIISRAIDPDTGEPLVLYPGTEAAFTAFSREHPRDDVPFRPESFFTRTPPPSSDTAHPVFLNAKTPDGEIDHIHDGDAWLVFNPAQIQNAVGTPHPLDQDDPTIVHTHSSAGDQPMANPIQNESAVYGEAPQGGEPDDSLVRDTFPDGTQEPWRMANGVVNDVLYYAEGKEKYDEAISKGDHELADDISGAYNLAHQQELSGFTLESYARDYDEAHRLNAEIGKQDLADPTTPTQDTVSPPTEKPAPSKRAKNTKPAPLSSPTPKAGKPKRKRPTKAKETPISEPKPVAPQEATTPAPAAAPAPSSTLASAGVAALDPHARQRLDRVASNRAAERAEAQKKLNADAVNRARIHLLQDPIGRHIVAIDRGGVTKAYAVDENPGIAAKTVNTLRDGIRKIGDLAGEINFLPDVIKTRFRLKSGEEKIAYNVDPEGVDPRHSQMREAGLGENDRRNLVVIPEGNPDEISRHVLLSSHLPDDVRKRFVYSDTVPGQYFDRNRKLAFIDKGGRLATDQNAPEIIASMVSVAQAKGWKAITVKGHEDFRREAWLAASLAGLEVKGFKPSDPDLAKLEYERQLRLGNAIQPALPTSAPVVNEMVGASPEAPPPAIGAEAVALGEVARLKGVREDQIPDFMKTAQAFIDEARRVGIDLPALKVFDPAAPATPAIATPDKAKEPARGIDISQPDKAPKR